MQVLSPRICPRFRIQVHDLGPRSQKMSQIQVLCPGIMSYVLENFLDLGSTSLKRSWVQSVGCRKGFRFRSIIPTFLSQVLVKLQDLGLGPRKVLRFRPYVLKMFLDLVPRSQKGPRFRSQFLEKVLDLGPKFQKMSKIQVLCPRFMSQVLENVLDLGSRSQIQALAPTKCHRVRSYALGLCPSYWKRFQNQVLRPGKCTGFGT